MSREEKLPPELMAFEAELASLRPDTGSLDTGHLMFLAGQESVMKRSRRWPQFAWPAAFTTMTAAAAVLLVMQVVRQQPEIVERIVRVEIPVQETAPNHISTPRADELPLAAQTVIAATAEDEQPIKNSVNRSQIQRFFVSLFLNPTPTSERTTTGRRQLSYHELRNHLTEKGIDSWPMHTPARPHRSNHKPMTRKELMKDLFSENS